MSRVSIIGASGVVGKTILKILEQREFPITELSLYASLKSEGQTLRYQGSEIQIQSIESYSGEAYDFAFFSAGAPISKKWAPEFARAGSVVIDNTSAFRMDPDVPLIVPEVNPEAVQYKKKNIISNPNCSTIQMLVAIKPLDEVSRIKRIVVSTYQAVSGAGKEAIDELKEQSQSLLQEKPAIRKVFPHRIAFNCIPHIDVFEHENYTKEEMKMLRETSKIMGRSIPLTATCVRVPALNCHSEAINIEFESEISPETAKEVLENAPGVKLVDDPQENLYPLASVANGKDDTFVGRVRKDESVPHGLNMWVVSDNLRKGAALNSIQIAELLLDS